ncbi:MAG TPA: rRNA maturation RNase YbeY [Gracilimonas sp.]|uniref:rRNA maturation RNase YbeY n=1 Tax=Gracilimonas sp. TaxID=1974203 RepID=UPI002D90BD75|nr:rRNA maturation RNase YbeY [Gracilimonas sp.]
MNNETSVLEIFNESEEKVPLRQKKAESILYTVSDQENARFAFVELVYVDEDEIVRINKEHLSRYYVTDIISFRYDEGQESQNNTAIEGTLFCCAPRILEQSAEFKEPVEREFQRIFIHGLLHLIGYEDSTEKDKAVMTELENKYLALSGSNK